jgi:soluble lytic murein transglycosylase-like protein
LYVPACLCLLAFSTSVGSELNVPPDRTAKADKAERLTFKQDNNDADAGAAARQGEEPASPVKPVKAVADIPPSDETLAAFAPAPAEDVTAIAEIPAPLPEAAPLPKPKPEIKEVVHRSAAEVCETLTQAANHHGLPVPFFIRLLFQESRFDPGAVSNAGAQGVAQFMPATASELGVDNPFDPLQAIPASARLLRSLFEKFGNLGLAAAAYNAGPGRIEKWLTKKGKLPEETQGYVKIITGRSADNWKSNETGTPAVKLPQRAPCQESAGLLAWNGPSEIPLPVTAPRRQKANDTAVVAAHDKAPAHKPVVQAAAKPAKTKEAKKEKAAVQLAARKQVKPKKVRVSER